MAGRRKRRKPKLETKRHTYFIIGYSLFALALYFFSVQFPAETTEGYIRGLSSIGTISFFVLAGCLIASLRDMFEVSYALLPRLAAMLLSLAGMAFWGFTYLLGLLSS